jgi:outer membrane immunogenic protein
MKKLALAAAAVSILFAGSASAADLPVRTYTKAPPVAASIYDWSGFYVGLNGGGGWSHKCWDLVTNILGAAINPARPEGCHDATGGLVGGQVGYRFQSGAWVFGLEAQGDWANLSGTNVSLLVPAGTNRSKIDAIGLFTGQVGYAWNNVLLYVKGGAAVADDRYDGLVTATGVVFDRGSNDTRWGGVVGTGLEVGFASNWSVAFEYDHAFMQGRTINFTAVPAGTFSRGDSIRQDIDMVTVRVNYRFGGPVVAKY